MKFRFTTLKPGSILVCRQYNIFKYLWYRIRKKALPKNKFILFTDTIDLLDTFPTNSDAVILEPKKNYSNREKRILNKLAKEYTNEDDIYSIAFKGKKAVDMVNLVNKVRPLSIPSDTSNVKYEDFCTNIYNNYHVKPISKKELWSVCVY